MIFRRRGNRPLVAALAAAVMLSTAVPAAGQDAAYDAIQRGDYDGALREWRPRAEAGNAEAQYNLAQMYNNGWGLDRDYRQSYLWFSLAALGGYDRAETRRRQLEQRLGPADLETAEELVAAWLESHQE